MKLLSMLMLVSSLLLLNVIGPRHVTAQSTRKLHVDLGIRTPLAFEKRNGDTRILYDPDDKELERILSVVQTRLVKLHSEISFPGATLGFVLPDGRAGSVSVGVSDLELKKPLVPSDRMPAGSIGKMFVAAVALQLAQEGKITLDEKIEHWFGADPWFPRLANAHDVTLRMLLNHTSGIPEHEETAQFRKDLVANPNQTRKPEELIAYILDKRALFPAGKKWSYADTNYILVGMIIERVTARSLYSEMARRLLTPLKLNNTIPSDQRVLPGVIPGYSKEIGQLINKKGPYTKMIGPDGLIINPQWEWAGGGLASTPEDLARWVKALFDGNVLEKAFLDQMTAGVKSEKDLKYGLGVVINSTRSGELYGHDGVFPGYISVVKYSPQHRVAVAIQFNSDFFSKVRKDGPPASFSLDEIIPLIVDALDKKPTGNVS